MEQTTYPPTDGADLRMAREHAGVSQDEVASRFKPKATTRQRLSRMERDGSLVSYVEASRYRAALDEAVAAKVGAIS